MAMTRFLLGRLPRRSSIPLLPSPAPSSSPIARRSLAGAMEAPSPSGYPAAAAARSFLAGQGLSPPMGLRSYRRSSGSIRQFSTNGDMKDTGTDNGMLVKLIKRFLKKIGHPSQFSGPELKEWGRNQKPFKDTNLSGPIFAMFSGALVVVWVNDDWRYIKASFNEFVGGLTGSVKRKD
ncbi:uncharacterized protein LOC124688140 [Lolium rigidum]|uniref:uncharacterized protein LOC124688140 n=1 Tax=Lolium rigidum TaxID=89674 RepID=UPI001F5C5F75|nr:uncharacterized protein LOC124688140 [Lolium rigidum]